MFYQSTRKSANKQSYESPQCVFITGGARGIGYSLCLEYIRTGTSIIIITDLKESLLSSAAQELQKFHSTLLSTKPKGATPTSQLAIVTKCVDVTNREMMTTAMLELDEAHHIDVVVASAGIGPHQHTDLTFEEATRLCLDVNINGVVNTIMPLKNTFRTRKAGQFILISSLLSIEPFKFVSYPASKAFVKSFGRGLRHQLANDNVSVVTFCPGWTNTRILDNIPKGTTFYGLVQPEVMAKRIYEAAIIDESTVFSPIWLAFLFIAVYTIVGPKIGDWLLSATDESVYTDTDLDKYVAPAHIKEKITLPNSNTGSFNNNSSMNV